jgi:signal transduction histidine kinase
VRSSANDLAAALDALLGNVFAHTPEGTALSLHLTRRPDGGARITVSDEGPGWPPHAKVGQRGASGTGSTGLGLDIAARTARSGGGTLRLQTAESGGATVTLELAQPNE